MNLEYKRIIKKSHLFLRLTGLTPVEFKKICDKVKPLWKCNVEDNKKRHGRNSNLRTIEDKMLALFIYYRTYITHEFLGYLLGMHNSNISRLFKKLEPILAQKITIKKDRTLTQEELIKILIDATEQPIQRPKKKSKQRKTYSGKKRKNTVKVEIIMQDTGKILAVSKSYSGRTHDFNMRKSSDPLPKNSTKYVDSGYQGLQKEVNSVQLPFKRYKSNPLTVVQKLHNKNLSSFRMKIENKFREIKIFKIMSDTYRNFQKKHNLRFNILAGVVNFKHGF